MYIYLHIYTPTRGRVVHFAMPPRALPLRTTRGGEKQAGETTEIKKERAQKSNAAQVALRVSPPPPSPLTVTLRTSYAFVVLPWIREVYCCVRHASRLWHDTYIYQYTYINIHISIHISVYIYQYIYQYTFINTYINIHILIYKYQYTYINIHISIYIYQYIYQYTYISILLCIHV